MRFLVVLAWFACSKYEPKVESEQEQDEAIVVTFEEMATLAGEKPTCQRWLSENARRWGAQRLQAMITRMQSLPENRQQAFRAKYGARIAAASASVQEISQRCLEEARNTPIE